MKDKKKEICDSRCTGGAIHPKSGNNKYAYCNVQNGSSHGSNGNGTSLHLVELIVDWEAIQKDAILP